MSEIKPSFSKALFSGHIMEELIFPYPKMNEEEAENIKMIIESFNKFASDKIDAAQIDLDAKIPEEVIEGLKELGFFGLNTPEEYDGFGLGSSGFTKMLSAISEVDSSVSLTIETFNSSSNW